MGGLLTVVYMTLPVTTKGVEITQRFLPFILFMLMLWMAVRPPSARLAAAAVAVVLAVVAGSTAYRFHKFGQYEGLIQEYESAGAHVEPGSVLLALHRSEEHTSELQSLMRISYAVFCLKKKKNKTIT